MSENQKKPGHLGHRERVKRSFLKGGLDSFEPHNALELLLFYSVPQKDTKPLARELIRHFGSFDKVLEADYESLIQVDGVGEHTATLIKLVLSTYRYYEGEKARKGFCASSTTAAISYAKSLFVGEANEISYLLCFDSRMQLINCVKLSEGSVNAASVTIRKIVEQATLNKAVSVILTHNHPGGNAVPSTEDLVTTKQVLKALDVIGIELNDHIIVSGRDALSFADTGVLFDIRKEIRGV